MRVVRGNPSTQVLKMKVRRDDALLHGQGGSNETGKARSALCVTINRILAFVCYLPLFVASGEGAPLAWAISMRGETYPITVLMEPT
jgi:hypothetical protein